MEEQAVVEGQEGPEVRAVLVVPAAAADPVPAALEILPTHARR